MGKEIRADYEQSYLLPPSLEDWLPSGHPARFIREFVDSLDLGGLGFALAKAEDGRPPYAADLLLKVWLYGYLHGIRSSRKMERACYEHIGLIWLTGRHYPDHNTLSRFLATNEDALRGVFRQVVYVAYRAGLVGLVLHAVDGTKIAAAVSTRGMWRRGQLRELLAKLDGSIEEALGQIKQADEVERGEYCLPEEIQDKERRRAKIKEALAELDEIKRNYLHPGDRDARLMKSGDDFSLAYNAQVVVDEKSGLIVAEAVVNDEADNRQLVPMVEAVKSNLGEAAEETVADAGYYSAGQLAAAENAGLSVSVPLYEETAKRWHKGAFQKANFTYDEQRDVYVCPLAKELTYEKTRKDSHGRFFLRLYRCRDYKECPKRGECSQNKRGRHIERGEHEKAVEHQRAKQREPAKRELLHKRKSIVEHVFGQIKEHQGLRRFNGRGLRYARTQWSMVCAALNLGKLHRYWAKGALVLS